VAILAGGLATRMRPMTSQMPKALLDVNGRPFVAWQLDWIRQQGGRRVVICAGYLGEQIRDAIGDGSGFGLEVEFVFDGPTLLGTAGALARALPALGGPFFVLYGDSYLPIPWRPVQEAFDASGRQALMTVFQNDGTLDRSNVEFEDGRILVYDKRAVSPNMRHIDYGLGLLRPDAFSRVPRDRPADLAALYSQLLDRDELAAYEVRERFYEIGSFEGLESTRQFLAGKTS
jgi:NDP-sugar pyrophosphorylase family protein